MSLVDRTQDPIFLASIVAGIGVGAIFRFALNTGWVVAGILGLLAGGALYIFYQDYKEKKRLDEATIAKEKDLKRRIREQAETELQTGKCVSCTTEIPEGAENCPKCGYKVKHYSTIDE